MIKETTIVDPKTGEIKYKKAQNAFVVFDEEKGYLFWNRRSFAKSFSGVDFPKETTMRERGQLATLAKKIWSNTNMLGYRGNGGIRPLSPKQIGTVIGVKEYQANAFLRKMIRLGIIAKVNVVAGDSEEVHYYINPIYFCSTNRITLNLYLLFREQLDMFLPDWVKDKYATQSKDNSCGVM